eukprot:symbB.v1.2.006348.t1/scaffold374.1/size218025/9
MGGGDVFATSAWHSKLASATLHPAESNVLGNVLEFPSGNDSSSAVGWFTFEGIAVAMLMVGLSYCALRAMLTGIKEVTCVEPPKVRRD